MPGNYLNAFNMQVPRVDVSPLANAISSLPDHARANERLNLLEQQGQRAERQMQFNIEQADKATQMKALEWMGQAALAAGDDPAKIELLRATAEERFGVPTSIGDIEAAKLHVAGGLAAKSTGSRGPLSPEGKLEYDRQRGYIPESVTSSPRELIKQFGNPPSGYKWTQTGELEAITGGPVTAKQAEADKKKMASQSQKSDAAKVVVQDIDRAISKITNSPRLTTGLMGEALSNVGGTEAADVKALLTTVKANAGFDRLQTMRENSPTGGALGQVSNLELGQLNAAIGSLEQSQSATQLIENAKRVKNIYLDIIHGKGNGPEREKLNFIDLGGGGDALDEARAAIKRGAPRDAVIERLKQMGKDPSRL